MTYVHDCMQLSGLIGTYFLLYQETTGAENRGGGQKQVLPPHPTSLALRRFTINDCVGLESVGKAFKP